MTIYGLVASIVWAGVVTYLARHGFTVTREWLAQRVQVAGDELRRGTTKVDGKLELAKLKADNRLEIARLSVPQAVARSTPMSRDITLPDDLEAYVMQWGDEWARDDVRGNVRAKYLEFHDGDTEQTWQRVRASVGIGTLP